MSEENVKNCSKKNCKQQNPQLLDNFYKNKDNKDGLDNNCKNCKKNYSKEYEQRPERKFKKKKYNSNPERKIKIKEREYWKTLNNVKKRKEYDETEKGKQKYKKYRRSLKGKYRDYKNSSQYRNIPFNLTFKQFETFWEALCFYCGIEIKTVGIDRVDNSVGYQMDNCVPCCKDCNYAKCNVSFDIAKKMIDFIQNKDFKLLEDNSYIGGI